MGSKSKKILGIGVGIFAIFVIVGITYEPSTGLNMITGEKKTSGAGDDKWIQEREDSQPIPIMKPKTDDNECDLSYPDFCIPKYASDLDCGDVVYSNFRVYPPDPHGFDRDQDGIGCEK